MALNVAWRWSMPQVADPNAQANDMASGIQGLTQGIGRMIGGIRKENREDEQRRQAQENWERTFDQNKLQSTLQQQNWVRQFAQNKAQQALAQENWQKTYEMQKALNDMNLATQGDLRDWLKSIKRDSLLGGYAHEDEYQQLKKLLFGDEQDDGAGMTDAKAIMLGLNPSLM